MTQAEEKQWREETVRACLVAHVRPKKIMFEGLEFCVRGFAVTIGGEFYYTTLKRTVRDQYVNHFSSTSLPISVEEQNQLKALLNDQSFVTLELEQYILELLNTLADTDPASGIRQVDDISVPEAYSLYEQDFSSLKDVPQLPSLRAFRRVWDRVVKEFGFSIRTCKSMSKCEICIKLRSLLKQVIGSLTMFLCVD
jgi:hypothetical protein